MRALLLFTLTLPALAGCLADSNEAENVEVQPIDAASLLGELEAFVGNFSERAGNTEDHIMSRDHLAGRFADLGLEVWRQEFTNGIAQENIIGIKWGTVRDQWVVVGGHYDMTTRDCNSVRSVEQQLPDNTTVPACGHRPFSEGAYDDGSGVMMTVALAKAYAETPTHYTIAFVHFDGEERGLQGSQNFTETVISQGTPWGPVSFRAMLNLDMIGLNWPGIEAPIYFDTNSDTLVHRMENATAAMGMPKEMMLYQGIRLGRSDYHWFMELEVPTGFMISDFESWQLPGGAPVTTPPQPDAAPTWVAYPFWHIEDTYETMELMAGDAAALEAGFQAAVDLASDQLAFMASDVDLQVQLEE